MCSQGISDQVRSPMDNHMNRAPTQTYTFSVLSLLSKYFIHHIQIKQKIQQVSFIDTEKQGRMVFNLIAVGKNIVLGRFVSPDATVTCLPPLANAIPMSHSAP